jgi:hypothetical protein
MIEGTAEKYKSF